MSKPKIRFKGYEEDWEQRKLGKLAEKTYGGGTPRTTEETFWNGEIPWFQSADLIEHEVLSAIPKKGITDIGLQNSAAQLIPQNSIAIVTRVGVGKLAFIPFQYTTSQDFLSLSDLNIDGKFGCYVLYKLLQKEKNLTQGTSIKGITKEELLKKEILAPRKQEQKQIGQYFSNLDHLITLHQRKCEETKKLKKYMLQKMFPQNGKRVPEIRFAGFTDDWEQRKLSEIATMHARIGWQNLRTSEFLDSGDYMLITGTDFEDGTINYSTCHYVEKERYEQDKNIQIRNGSILITKDGTLGKVAYVQGLTMPATLNAGVFNVEIKDKKETDEKYLFQYLKAPFLMDYVTRHATGGTIKHLNQSILINFPVYMPKKSEQEKIGLYLMQLDSLITLHQRKYEELQKIKKFMLQNMFI